jgi:hypothetical protein
MSDNVIYILSHEEREYTAFLRRTLIRKDENIYYWGTGDGILCVGDIEDAINEYEKYLVDMRIYKMSDEALKWQDWSYENIMIQPKEISA